MAGPSKPSVQGGAIIAKNYHLLGKIGEGSFGVIFLGKNIENREQVAIKIEAKVSSQPQTLLEEARLLKALHSTSKDGIVVGIKLIFVIYTGAKILTKGDLGGLLCIVQYGKF